MRARRAAPDPGVLVADDREQLHQVLACLVPVLARGPADDVEQPAERRLDVAGAQQEVRGPGLRRDVVRCGLGGCERIRAGLLGAAEQLHLPQRQRRLGVVGLGGQDRPVGGFGGGQVALLERGLGRVQAQGPRPARRASPSAPGTAPPVVAFTSSSTN